MKFSAFLLLLRLLPSPRLFPYTTLFRSGSASVTPFPTDRIVTILGGTGPQGRGLARRFAAAGIPVAIGSRDADRADRKSTRLNSSHLVISYAVFCLQKKTKIGKELNQST